jgi:hypothetical protein
MINKLSGTDLLPEKLDELLKNARVPDISGLGGGYIPKNNVIINNYKLACIIIESDSNSAIKAVLIEVKDKEEKSVFFTKCGKFSVKSGRFIIQPTSTKLGDISFEGNFLKVMGGKYLGNVAYDTVVLKGRLRITNSQKRLYTNNRQEFTYVSGD